MLGLKPSLSLTEIDFTAKYRKLAKLHHPDVGGNHDVFVVLLDAYEALIDPARRLQIDIECGLIVENDFSSEEVDVVLSEDDDSDYSAVYKSTGKKRKRSTERRKQRKKELKRKKHKMNK